MICDLEHVTGLAAHLTRWRKLYSTGSSLTAHSLFGFRRFLRLMPVYLVSARVVTEKRSKWTSIKTSNLCLYECSTLRRVLKVSGQPANPNSHLDACRSPSFSNANTRASRRSSFTSGAAASHNVCLRKPSSILTWYLVVDPRKYRKKTENALRFHCSRYAGKHNYRDRSEQERKRFSAHELAPQNRFDDPCFT